MHFGELADIYMAKQLNSDSLCKSIKSVKPYSRLLALNAYKYHLSV